jgi:hypothetical protein
MLSETVVGEGAADGCLGGGEVGGELGDASAVLQQGAQAGAQVGEALPPGPLLKVAVAPTLDHEAALDAEAARRTCWWGCFPCARRAGRPTTPGEPSSSAPRCRWRTTRRAETKRMGNAATDSSLCSAVSLTCMNAFRHPTGSCHRASVAARCQSASSAARAAAAMSAFVFAWPAMPQVPSGDLVISTQVRFV